ncbi:hypothetical protein LIER_32559 [Lithospermum erythrorhizon]|uniref:Uncharacterized protein n=1 Tax=Lithospermum erythrorhizon TaxID=34254 RepID=A0AAV3QU29_LITER
MAERKSFSSLRYHYKLPQEYNIFTLIKNAIKVAKLQRPREFDDRKAEIISFLQKTADELIEADDMINNAKGDETAKKPLIVRISLKGNKVIKKSCDKVVLHEHKKPAENVVIDQIKKFGVPCPKKTDKSFHAHEAKEFKKEPDYHHVTMEKNSYSEKLESSAKRVFDKYKEIKECKRTIQVIDWIPENVHIQSTKKSRKSLAPQTNIKKSNFKVASRCH